METPEYTSSCAITQKIKPTNVRVVKISEGTPIPKSSLEVLNFELEYMHIHHCIHPQALKRNDTQLWLILGGAFCFVFSW